MSENNGENGFGMLILGIVIIVIFILGAVVLFATNSTLLPFGPHWRNIINTILFSFIDSGASSRLKENYIVVKDICLVFKEPRQRTRTFFRKPRVNWHVRLREIQAIINFRTRIYSIQTHEKVNLFRYYQSLCNPSCYFRTYAKFPVDSRSAELSFFRPSQIHCAGLFYICIRLFHRIEQHEYQGQKRCVEFLWKEDCEDLSALFRSNRHFFPLLPGIWAFQSYPLQFPPMDCQSSVPPSASLACVSWPCLYPMVHRVHHYDVRYVSPVFGMVRYIEEQTAALHRHFYYFSSRSLGCKYHWLSFFFVLLFFHCRNNCSWERQSFYSYRDSSGETPEISCSYHRSTFLEFLPPVLVSYASLCSDRPVHIPKQIFLVSSRWDTPVPHHSSPTYRLLLYPEIIWCGHKKHADSVMAYSISLRRCW